MSTTAPAADPALPVPRIFVSATTGDLGTVRSAVADGMRGIGALAVEQEYFAPPGMTIADMLEEKIRACQAVIHIAGHRYGAEDENTPLARRGATYADGRRSYTQLEHDLALRHGKRLYVFLCADGFPYDPAPDEPAALAALQQEHRQRLLTSSHFRHSVGSGGDIAEKLSKLDEHIRTIAGELARTRRRQRIAFGIGAAAILALAGGGWWLAGRTGDVEKYVTETKQTVVEASENISAVMRELHALKQQLATAAPTVTEIIKDNPAPALAAAASGAADPIRAARAEVMKKLSLTEPELDARLAGEKNTLTDLLTALRTLKPTAVNELTAARHLTREVLRKLGKAEEAAIHYENATEHYREAAALYDPKAETTEWADAQNDLALILLQNGKYDEGTRIAETALKGFEDTLGNEHPAALICLNNLAELYRIKGDTVKAEPLYLRAMQAKERTLGKEHPSTLISVNNLALLYDAKGETAKAEALHLRALEASERTHGAEHPATLNSANNLAMLYANKGGITKAETLLLQTLEARERTLGKEHPDTLTSINNLAGLFRAKGNTAGAEPLYLRALEARERTLGKEHPDTLVSVNNLAGLYRTKGDIASAEPLYTRALEAQERTLGKEHPDTLISVSNLAALYSAKGDTAKAESLTMRVLDARERTLGKEHPDTCLSAYNLAVLSKKQGTKERVAHLARQAHSGWLKSKGPEHEDTKDAAALLRELGETP